MQWCYYGYRQRGGAEARSLSVQRGSKGVDVLDSAELDVTRLCLLGEWVKAVGLSLYAFCNQLDSGAQLPEGLQIRTTSHKFGGL